MMIKHHASAEIFSDKKLGDLDKYIDTRLLESLRGLGYQCLTRVQAQSIPQILSSRDVVVQASTGSGKTLAYLIPVVELILRKISKIRFKKNHVGAIILSPTRELAIQTYDILSKILLQLNTHLTENEVQDEVKENDSEKEHPLQEEEIPNIIRHILLIGGSGVDDDIQNFCHEGAHIVIATPGRLEHLLLRSSIFNCRELEILILDEADRLLDLGFERSITNILSKLPTQRLNGLFSATMSDALEELLRLKLRNPVSIIIRSSTLTTAHNFSTIPQSLDIYYMICKPEDKLPHLIHLICSNPDKRFMVYFATCYCVNFYYRVLTKIDHLGKFKIFALHGRMPSSSRSKIYRMFSTFTETPYILLCTDVAARGLDVPNIHWVIQLDSPQDERMFIHRSGRTARLNSPGNALIYLNTNEELYLRLLERRGVSIKELPVDFRATELPVSPESLTSLIRHLCINDRDVFEKGLRAFVSWCRYYREHKANLILKFSELDIPSLVRMFGLIKLPKMPELKKFDTKSVNIPQIDTNSIKYLNPEREKKRLNTSKSVVYKRKEHPRSTTPWSKKNESKYKETSGGKNEKTFPLNKKKKTTEGHKREIDDVINAEFKKIEDEIKKEKRKTRVNKRNRTELNIDWSVEDDLPIHRSA